MPIFLDRHDLSGLTAADIAEAHRKDLEVQSRYGVKFLTYWFDATRGGADGEGSSARHCIARIDCEVGDHVLDLITIGHHQLCS